MMFGAGSVSGALLATFVERSKLLGPYSCFAVYLSLLAAFGIFVYFMDDDSQEIVEEKALTTKFCENIS